MVLLLISTGVRTSFGVYIDPLVEEYGWSRSAVSLAYMVQFLSSIPVILAVGHLGDRLSPRRIVMVGSVIFTIGMLLTGTITQVWQFQLYFGLLTNGLGTSAFMTLLPVLLTRWFYRKTGLALGFMWASMSLGTMVFSPLMRWGIEAAGWRETFIIVGLIGGALMLVSASLLRDYPQEKGLAPYGGLPSELPLQNPGASVGTLNLHQVTVLTSFWALVAVHILGCIGHAVPLVHMVSIATLTGVSGIAAAGMLSVTSIASLLSRFGMSLVSDARGGRFTLTLALLFQTLPILLLLSARELWWFYSFAFLFGLGYGGEMVGFPIFNRQYYGRDAALNTIYSYQLAGAALGMATGGWLGGALFDLTGAYTWSILVAVAAGFIGMIAALVLPAYRRR
jgi:MFS family permease